MLNFPSNAKMLAANRLHLKVDQLVRVRSGFQTFYFYRSSLTYFLVLRDAGPMVPPQLSLITVVSHYPPHRGHRSGDNHQHGSSTKGREQTKALSEA